MEGHSFIFDYQRIPTDSIEEQVLLYRIGQRVEIAMRLKRKKFGTRAGDKVEAPREATSADAVEN